MGEAGAGAAHFFPIVLSTIGYDVAIIAKKGGDGEALRNAGVQVFEIGSEKSWLFSVRKIMLSQQPDIVHVFIHAGCGVYPFLAIPNNKIRFVLDIRSPLLKTGLSRYIVQLKNKLEPYGYNSIIAHGIQSAQTVIGKKKRIEWVPPGVNIQLFPYSIPQERENNNLRLVYVGSLDKKRKICQMMEATLILMQKKSLSLDIYGDGNEKHNLLSMIEDCKFSDQIHLHGSIPQEKLFNQLPGYDIGLSYVPTSLYDKAPPLKTLEFMAAYLPVVGTDTVGNRMFIKDGINGILAKESPEKYSEGILSLVNASWRVEASIHARVLAEQFDWKKITLENLIPVYNDIVK